MPTRALIVLLLILNLGVALWWATRDAPATRGDVPLPQGTQPLQLLREQAATAPRPTVAAPATAPTAPPASEQVGTVEAAAGPQATRPVKLACHAFGPFTDASAAARARDLLRPAVQRLATRETRPAARGWRVHLPALAGKEAADAMAARLREAGFQDHYLMPAGEGGAIDVALGRFGSEPAARRHEAALRAAGFAAVAEPLGDAGDARYWIDVAAGEGTDIAALRRATGAAEAGAIDCAGVPAAGG